MNITAVVNRVRRRILRADEGAVDHEDAVAVARRAGLMVNETRKHGASWNGVDIRTWVPCRSVLLAHHARVEQAWFLSYSAKRPFMRVTPISYLPHRRREPETLIHDVAHYLVCPVRRRRVGDFGLGPDPDMHSVPGYDRQAPEIVTGDYANREEHRASILGILIEAAIMGNAKRRFEEHSWHNIDNERDRDFDNAVAWLLRHGHIDDRGNPMVMS